MPKRRISKNKLSSIAAERVSILTRLSGEALRKGNTERAKRYVTLAVRICQKTNTRMPEDFAFCKGCHVPLVPGINLRIRVCRERVIKTCGECGNIRRMPYIKEKRT